MEDQKQTSFTLMIVNFSELEDPISSPNFLSGGYEWSLEVYPKGKCIKDYLTLYLQVANPESLPLGLNIRANFSFVLLNQSGQELTRANETYKLFSVQFPRWAISTSLTVLQEKGVFAENKLILKVEVQVVEVEVVDEADVTGDETLDLNGFQVLYSQVDPVRSLFMKHPCVAVNFRLTNQLVRTTYMNVLLGLIDTLNKPPHSISDIELRNAHSELIELTEVGFKLDWLMMMLNEVALERKKENGNGSLVQELEEQFTRLNIKSNKEKIKSTNSATRDWLKGVVHSWNKWKGRLGFANHLRYEKID